MQDHEFRQLVERVKLRSPIETIVAERVSELRQKGALFWARCPFHEERTPSFAVDPRKGTWRCFGACGEGGDVLSFIQRFDGLSFLDSLRMLAQACGETVPEESLRKRAGGAKAETEPLLDVLDRAERLYTRKLAGPEGRAAMDYIRERGFTDATLELFGIGWAPIQGSPLVEAAREAGVDPTLMIRAGLVRRAEDGRAFDFFRGRLMIPIRDRMGRTVGFGGRHLPGDTKALGKYVNTSETALFHKSQLIFGLDLAAAAVRKTHHMVLVEGYTDVMAAHQAGLEYVAAVLGTSTTEEHAALVRRSGARRVTLVFDGDEAGRRASQRALLGLLPLGVELAVVNPPDGADPCDLLLATDGAANFERMLAEAPDWFTWALEDLRCLTGAALAAGVDELFALLRQLGKPVEQDARLVELARSLGISEGSVRRQWEAMRPTRRRASQVLPDGAPARSDADVAPTASPSASETPAPDPQLAVAFGALIGALLLDNSLIPVYGELEPQCPAGPLKTILRAVLQQYDHGEEGEPIHAGSVMTLLGDDPARDCVVGLEDSARTAESPQILARDQERWLERRRHQHELAALRTRLRDALSGMEETSEATELLRDLHQELRRNRIPEQASS